MMYIHGVGVIIPIAQMGKSKLPHLPELDPEQPRAGTHFSDYSLISHLYTLVSMGLHKCRLMFPVLDSIAFWMSPIYVSPLGLHTIPCLGRNPHLKYGMGYFYTCTPWQSLATFPPYRNL